MPRHRCLVWGCNRLQDEILQYYKLTNRRYDLWLNALGRNADENLATSNVICCKHFSEKNYATVGDERKLKEDAVPDINLRTIRTETRPSPSTATGPPPQKKLRIETKTIPLESEICPDIESPCKNKVSVSSQNDSKGLKGSPKYRRKLNRTMHNYALSPIFSYLQSEPGSLGTVF